MKREMTRTPEVLANTDEDCGVIPPSKRVSHSNSQRQEQTLRSPLLEDGDSSLDDLGTAMLGITIGPPSIPPGLTGNPYIDDPTSRPDYSHPDQIKDKGRRDTFQKEPKNPKVDLDNLIDGKGGDQKQHDQAQDEEEDEEDKKVDPRVPRSLWDRIKEKLSKLVEGLKRMGAEARNQLKMSLDRLSKELGIPVWALSVLLAAGTLLLAVALVELWPLVLAFGAEVLVWIEALIVLLGGGTALGA